MQKRFFFTGPFLWLEVMMSAVQSLLEAVLAFGTNLRHVDKELPLPPGSLGWPIVGEMLQFIRQSPTGEFFLRRQGIYGPIFKTHILFKPTIFVSGPEAVREVLFGEHQFVENCWPGPMHRLLGPGALATSQGHHHKARRQAILRCFSREFFQSCLPLMGNVIEEELERWSTSTRHVEVYGCAKRMTIRAAAEVLIGVKAGDIEEISRCILEYSDGFFALPLDLPGTAFHKALRAKKRLHEILSFSLNERSSGPCSKLPSVDLISRIVDDNEASDDEGADHVIDQALELLFGGQETISAFVTCLILLLSENDHVIAKLSRELAENHMFSEDSCETIDMASLDKMTYVDCVIREVLRFYPPIGGGYRRVIKDFEIQGFRIPKDWAITYSIKATHDSSPLFSKDKSVFRPERWLLLPEKTSSLRMRHHFLPFGAGARGCVGKRYALEFMRLFTVLLIRRMSGWSLPTSDPVMLSVPIVRPKNGLFVRFQSRKFAA